MFENKAGARKINDFSPVDMNTSDAMYGMRLASESFLISSQNAQLLEKQCDKDPGDLDVRCQLLGFYWTHQLCCPQYRDRRIANIIWLIDNFRDLKRGINILLLPAPGDGVFVSKIRDAWQRRIDLAPDDPLNHQNMGDFLLSTDPAAACPYYEKTFLLNGDEEIASASVSAKLLARHGTNLTDEDYGQNITCVYKVLQAGDQLLQETQNRMQPSAVVWNEFFDIAHELIWSLSFVSFSQTACQVPLDSPASMICKSALRSIYKTIHAKSEIGRSLRKSKLKALWKDLVND